MRKDRSGALFLTAGFALAGTAPTAAKVVSGGLGPFTVTAAGLAFALPILVPFALAGGKPKPKELAATALLGFTGIFVYRYCLVSALSLIGAGEAGLMTGAAPALTAVASWLFLRERASPAGIAGVLLASAGILLIAFGSGGTAAGAAADVGTRRAFGLILAFGAAAAEAAFAVISRATRDLIPDQRRRTALTTLWAFLFAFAPALAEQPAPALKALPIAGWAALLWYGALTAVSYVCFYEGIRRVEASRAAVFTGIVPVVALALPLAVLGERPSMAALAGCALIVGGIRASSIVTGKRAGVVADEGAGHE